jgi:CheY-like chemotaxis protein
MDGKEAIQRIRANEKWQNLPVIALTADAMTGDREKYIALGMTDYVSKPVDQRELLAKMYSVLKLDAPAGAAPVAAVKTGTTGA